MEQDSLSYKTLRNSSYFFVGYLAPILAAVFVTPFILHRIGLVAYGIFILVNTVTSFLNFIDFGLSTSLTKFTAEYQARGDYSRLTKLIQSAQSLSYLFGFVGLIIFIVMGKWLLPLFHIQDQTQHNIFLVFVLGGVIFFLNSAMMAINAVPTALQRFDIITKINLANLIISNILIVAVVAMGFQLKAIMAVNIFVLLLTYAVYRLTYNKLLPQVPLEFRWYPEEIKIAYQYGFMAFVSNLAASSLIFVDRLIIPIFLGPAQLSYYSLPGNVALKTSGVTNSLSPMLFPMASAMTGVGDTEKLKTVYVRAFRNLSLVAAALTTSIILFANKILFFWLGADIANHGTGILIILALTYYLVSLYIPLNSMLLGMGKVSFLIKQSVFMAALNIVLLLVLIPLMGIVGAAWAYLISVVPMIYAFYWVEQGQFKITGKLKYYLKFYFKLFVTALAEAVIVELLILPLVHKVYYLVVLGPVSVLPYFALYYLFGFLDQEDLATFKTFFAKFIQAKFQKKT